MTQHDFDTIFITHFYTNKFDVVIKIYNQMYFQKITMRNCLLSPNDLFYF